MPNVGRYRISELMGRYQRHTIEEITATMCCICCKVIEPNAGVVVTGNIRMVRGADDPLSFCYVLGREYNPLTYETAMDAYALHISCLNLAIQATVDEVSGSWVMDHGRQQWESSTTTPRPWRFDAEEPDPADEDPVLNSIVMAIPADVQSIFIITQRLVHVLSGLKDYRETGLAVAFLKEAAHWLGAHLHAGGTNDDN